ncbi:MAG: 50S ribosomal protein L11 methyltransferase [Actinomycetota bacterium]
MMSSSAPAREFEWKGRTGPFVLRLSPSVFVPTHTSRLVAEALEVHPGETVIDVGCGSGILSFVAARLGAGRTYGTDISPEAVRVAADNARRLGLEEHTEFRAGSLLEPLPGVVADVVVGDVSGIPDELAAATDWFPGGHAGGPTGAEVPVAMLETVGEHLRPGGRLYLPTGSIQDERRVLETARRLFGAANLERVLERELPLPALLARSKALARMMAQGLVDLRRRGSRLLWRLAVWRCVRV